MDEGDWVVPEGEGFSEVVGVSVEVIRMAADAMPPSGKRIRDGTFD